MQKTGRSAQVLIGTAGIMAILSATKVVLVGAIVFVLFAALYVAAAWLTVRRRIAGPIVALLPSLIIVGAEGQILLAQGLRPSAYSPASDFLIVVLGTPVALGCLVVAIVVLTQARRRPTVRASA